MKKTFFTLCLGLACLPILAVEEKEMDIEEITVTAQRAQIASESLRVITSLTRDDIEALPVQNINELLDYLPGIDIRQRGSNGTQADISMRGGTFDQVLILLNGVNITDVQSGHHNLDLPIELGMIDRIEILQGTNMNLFGLSAFSGAINIITGQSKPDAPPVQANASLTAGQYGLFNPALGGKFKADTWTISASASYNESSGYTYNTGYEYGNIFLQARTEESRSGRWNIQLGGQLKEFGANAFYSLSYPDQFEATKTLLGSVGWDKTFGQWNISASAYFRTHYDRFELIHDLSTAPAWYTGHNYHLNRTLGANLKASYFSRIGKSTIGIEVRDDHILSTVLGDSLDTPRPVPFTQDSVMFLFSKDRLNLNYFAEQAFYFGQWAASVGISGNYNNMFKHNFCFGANIGYQFAREGNVYANVNRSLRLPTYTDLYYKSATQIANPGLKPETALTTEIGAKWAHKGLRTQISAYYRIGENIIDWIKLPEEEQWRSMNHTRVDGMGGEASVSYRYGYWLKNIGVSYSFCHLDKDAGEYMSKYALDYLKHKLVFSLEHGIYKGFGASWQLSYQSRVGTYTDRSGVTTAYRPFWLLDGRIYWTNKQITVYAEATNLTDCTYYDYGGILQPQRWVKTGIQVKL